MRGATALYLPEYPTILYFNPRSSCEERLEPSFLYVADIIFQSTLLMRGATLEILQRERQSLIFQSTLLMRGATRSLTATATRQTNFNPRSSCEERPSRRLRRSSRRPNFNPRSSCEERRDLRAAKSYLKAFQSTLLMRGATHYTT